MIGWFTRRRVIIIAVWLATKILVLGAVAIANWSVLTSRPNGFSDAYLALWRQWDTYWFESIQLYGYVGPYVDAFHDYQYNVAFFPGYPVWMIAGSWVGLPAIGAGLIVSAAASLVAAFGIARLTEQIGGRAEWGTVALLVAPTALFLTAAYTEALFCAFAFWAWILARRGAWVWAGVLAAAAAITRSNGLFLMVGLVVMFLLTRPWREGRRVWWRASALLLPLVVTLGYFVYLWAITGQWNAWNRAQTEFWERHLVDPVTSLVNTVQLIWTFSPTGEPSSRMVTEILAMGLLLALVAVLAVKRWWPEAVYAAVTALALGTSTMYHSVPRTLVVVFPLWMVLGLWLTRYRWLRWAYILLGVPALVLVAVRFTQGQWIS